MNGDDRSDADLGALLRATFAGEARQQVPDTRGVPPYPAVGPVPTAHPHRRRWVGLGLVAAAMVAVVTGGALLTNGTSDSAPRPTPAGTSVAPATPAPSTSAAPSSSPASSSPVASTPPAATTRPVTFHGVVLAVPTAWNVVDRPAGDSGETASLCLTPDTAIRQTGDAVDDCQLNVVVGAALWGSHDVDRVGFAPDGGLCGTDHRTPHQTDTTVADEVVVDGYDAEHRGFTGSCLDQVLDQWTIPTAPFVQFWRAYGPADPTGRAQALAVVQSARLPGPRSALRLDDHGYLTAVTGDAVSLDRVTYLNQLGVRDDNPATYDYPLAADVAVTYGGTPLTVAQLQDLGAGRTVAGVPPLGQLVAELTTDGSQVTALDLSDRRS